MSSTSNDSYYELKESGKKNRLEFLVTTNLFVYPDSTAGEIASSLGVRINSISPRMAQLEQAGHVKKTGKRKCKVTGRNCLVWSLGGTEMPKKKTPYERGFEAGYLQANIDSSPKDEPL